VASLVVACGGGIVVPSHHNLVVIEVLIDSGRGRNHRENALVDASLFRALTNTARVASTHLEAVRGTLIDSILSVSELGSGVDLRDTILGDSDFVVAIRVIAGVAVGSSRPANGDDLFIVSDNIGLEDLIGEALHFTGRASASDGASNSVHSEDLDIDRLTFDETVVHGELSHRDETLVVEGVLAGRSFSVEAILVLNFDDVLLHSRAAAVHGVPGDFHVAVNDLSRAHGLVRDLGAGNLFNVGLNEATVILSSDLEIVGGGTGIGSVGVAELTSNGVSLSIDVDSLEARVLVVVTRRPEESVLVVAISIRLGPADFNFFVALSHNSGAANAAGTSSQNNGSVIVGGSHGLLANAVIHASSNGGGSGIDLIALVEDGRATN